MNRIILFLLLVCISSVSFAALLPAPADVRNRSSQLEVLPPMGFLGCELCQNPFMGGVKGPSTADFELWRRYKNDIFGEEDSQNNGRADSIKED